ncbi:MAG: phytoene desaturase [Spirochaetales bacterium]|nr:phytoene desaturase [Spirochaetales bacterium]
MARKIIIIGAGLAGLAGAALLAKKGYKVVVLEKNSIPGGVAGRFEKSGFLFDTGPTWYLMPEVYDRFFGLFGKKPGDYYTLHHCNPSYKIIFEGQGEAVISRDQEHNRNVFDSFETSGGHKLKRFLENSKEKFSIAVAKFLYREYTSILDFASPRLLLDGLRLNIFDTLHSFVKKYFSDHRPQKVVEFNTVFLGSSPFSTPALYSLMAHADITQGVYHPAGGIYKLVEALVSLGSEYGVEYRYNQEVTGIECADRTTTGVQTANSFESADIVVSALDYHHTDTALTPKKYRNYSKRYWNSRILAPSAFLIFLGLNKKIPQLEHHNFYFAENWDRHFTEIFNKPAWPENPSYYIGVPSRTDPTAAPINCENIFILVPTAPGLDDPDTIRETFAAKIISHIETQLNTQIKKHIIYQQVFSQRDFFHHYYLFNGTALGLSHTLFQTALFRPSRKNKKLKNMYYTGHYTQPGIGMPMAIIGAELLADRIIKEQPHE